LGETSPTVAAVWNNLAGLYQQLGRMTDAETSYQRSLAILEKQDGPDHRELAAALLNYASLLRKMKRKGEARRSEERAKALLAEVSARNAAFAPVHASAR